MKYLIIILCAATFVGCEETVTDPDWPEHREQLVVVGHVRLQGESMEIRCSVSRTLPLQVIYREDAAAVNDALVTLTHDDSTIAVPGVTGVPTGPWGIRYNHLANHMRPSSTRYLLSVEHAGRSATASVRMPAIPLAFDSVSIVTSGQDQSLRYVLDAGPVDTVRYRCAIEILPPGASDWITYLTVELPVPPEGLGKRHEGTARIWIDPIARIWPKRYRLTACSPAFSELETALQGRRSSGGDPFEAESRNPRFNVSGEGIGFFWIEQVGEPVEIVN